MVQRLRSHPPRVQVSGALGPAQNRTHPMTVSRESFKRIVALAACAAITMGALAACNTIEGAGQDVKSTGKAIEKTADDAK